MVFTAQMVPVIASMLEAAMRTDAIRASLEEAREEIKENTKAYREAIKKENERWDIVKAALEDKVRKCDIPFLLYSLTDVDVCSRMT
jgi:hypothetical protein